MADIASTDVTVTVVKRRVLSGSPGSVHRHLVKIAFGNGVLNYPADGVPLPAAQLFGLQSELEYLILLDGNDGSGLHWKYDYENKKLRAWQGAAGATHTHALHVQTGAAANALTGAANQFRSAAAAFDIAGVANSAGEGGVVAAAAPAAGAQTELGNVAVAAQVMYAEAVGW